MIFLLFHENHVFLNQFQYKNHSLMTVHLLMTVHHYFEILSIRNKDFFYTYI